MGTGTEQEARVSGRLTVKVTHRGQSRTLIVRDVVVEDEEQIERAFPVPRPPVASGGGGAKFPDFTDPDYLGAQMVVDRDRKIARIAMALTGEDPLAAEWTEGQTELKARVAALKRHMKAWQVEQVAREIVDPEQEEREEGVAREMTALFPTSTPAPGN